MVLIRASILVALAGCFSGDAVECADGRLCPAGTRCHEVLIEPVETVCVTPDEQAACLDLPDYTRCLDGGRCYSGACLPGGCGNRRRDLADPAALDDVAEVCDDGNRSPGDGCAADCMSDEQCRNGTLDAIGGEQCDDANAVSHDGCSSTCAGESAVWVPVPVPRLELDGYTMVYDARRERIVVFGGFVRQGLGSFSSDATLEWDGNRWTQVHTDLAPPARSNAAMAYDARRGRTVLFGGNDFADTWEWDGARWSVASAVGPQQRAQHAMAYDAVRGRVVMFGGRGTAGLFGDTWVWDGVTWTELAGPGPSPRAAAAMAFDAVRGRVVMFGGADAVDQLADTWELAGDTWVPLAVAGPAARRSHAMATHPTTGRAVISGGASSEVALTDLWMLDDATWVPLPGQSLPIAQHNLAPFPPRGALVTQRVASEGFEVSTLEWIDGRWNARDTGSLDFPRARVHHAQALDHSRGELVVFGGTTDDGATSETWLWNGRWRRAAPRVDPLARDRTALAYDARRSEVVMFGGNGSGVTTLGDTWTFDGQDWIPKSVPGPGPRVRHAMAYDAARGQVILFGGELSLGGSQFADTWIWDGAAWTEVTSPTSPPALAGHTLAYDARRREVVLFAGERANVANDQTWIWNGTTWRDAAPARRPPARIDTSATYDPLRGRVVVYGGRASSTFTDVWEWTGTEWEPLPITVAIPARFGHALAFAPNGLGVLVFGGNLPGERTDEAFLLRHGSTFASDRCGSLDTDGDGLAGCADPDCWHRCNPLCPPGLDPTLPECTMGPRCGDGTCSALESCGTCPRDCGECPASCGDFACAGGETAATCPGDCPPT